MIVSALMDAHLSASLLLNLRSFLHSQHQQTPVPCRFGIAKSPSASPTTSQSPKQRTKTRSFNSCHTAHPAKSSDREIDSPCNIASDPKIASYLRPAFACRSNFFFLRFSASHIVCLLAASCSPIYLQPRPNQEHAGRVRRGLVFLLLCRQTSKTSSHTYYLPTRLTAARVEGDFLRRIVSKRRK